MGLHPPPPLSELHNKDTYNMEDDIGNKNEWRILHKIHRKFICIDILHIRIVKISVHLRRKTK